MRFSVGRGVLAIPNTALIPQRPEYYVQTGSMFENPYGVPHDEIMAMLMELPAEMAAQVIFGKYVESSGLVFSGELIQMMIDRTQERITGDRWRDKDAVEIARLMRNRWLASGGNEDDYRRQAFAGGVDFARQTDFTVISVIDTRLRPARLVYYRRLNRVPWESIYREIGRAMWLFGPSFLGDATGMAGDVIFDNLYSRAYCPIHDRTFMLEHGRCIGTDGMPLPVKLVEGDPLYGATACSDAAVNLGAVEDFVFSTNSKKQLIEHSRNTMSVGYIQGSEEPFGWIRIPPIVQIEEEHAFYAWDDKGLDTDTVMSLALALWMGLKDVPQESWVGGTR